MIHRREESCPVSLCCVRAPCTYATRHIAKKPTLAGVADEILEFKFLMRAVVQQNQWVFLSTQRNI
jgi:hypothetical protein